MPHAVLMDDAGNIKIIDFGFANVMREGTQLQTFCGSPAYAAPGSCDVACSKCLIISNIVGI
jgi:serine/threonine protein kinase